MSFPLLVFVQGENLEPGPVAYVGIWNLPPNKVIRCLGSYYSQ